MYKILTALLALLTCTGVSAQQDKGFMLEIRGGVLIGGLRDEMFSPLNYNLTGFQAGLRGTYRFGKNQIDLALSYRQAKARTSASDNFTSDCYGGKVSLAYLRQVWHSSNKLTLWCGGGYSFGLDGMIWKTDSYTCIAAHMLRPAARLDWNIRDRYLLSTGISFYLIGFVARPPYNYLPEMDELPHNNLYYVMRELGNARFAALGTNWDVNWNAEYHYRISRRFMLGARYSFRFQQYNKGEPTTFFHNAVEASVKIKL